MHEGVAFATLHKESKAGDIVGERRKKIALILSFSTNSRLTMMKRRRFPH